MNAPSLHAAVADLPPASREVLHAIYGLTSGRSRCVHALVTLWNEDEAVLRARLVEALQTLERIGPQSVGMRDAYPKTIRNGYVRLLQDVTRGAWRHHQAAAYFGQTKGSQLRGGRGCHWTEEA